VIVENIKTSLKQIDEGRTEQNFESLLILKDTICQNINNFISNLTRTEMSIYGLKDLIKNSNNDIHISKLALEFETMYELHYHISELKEISITINKRLTSFVTNNKGGKATKQTSLYNTRKIIKTKQIPRKKHQRNSLKSHSVKIRKTRICSKKCRKYKKQ